MNKKLFVFSMVAVKLIAVQNNIALFLKNINDTEKLDSTNFKTKIFLETSNIEVHTVLL